MVNTWCNQTRTFGIILQFRNLNSTMHRIKQGMMGLHFFLLYTRWNKFLSYSFSCYTVIHHDIWYEQAVSSHEEKKHGTKRSRIIQIQIVIKTNMLQLFIQRIVEGHDSCVQWWLLRYYASSVADRLLLLVVAYEFLD